MSSESIERSGNQATLDTEAVLQHLLERSTVAQRLRVEGRCRGVSDLREIVAITLDLANDAHQPSLSDAIAEVEKYRNEQNDLLKRALVLRESADDINRLNCVTSTANNLLERLRSLRQRED